MTNEKAIKEIRQWIKGCPYPETKEAFDLAIMALNHEVYWEDVKQALNGWLNNTTSQNTALNDICKAYMGRGEPTKPQGEWKIGGKTTHYYYCSICGKDGDLQDNFCRNCGADMRGAE